MRELWWSGTAIAVCMFSAASLKAQDTRTTPQQEAARVQRELRRGNIHGAAVLNGGTLIREIYLEPDNAPSDIEMISSQSHAVFVGVPTLTRSTPAFSQVGTRINTYFRVRISETLKGPAHSEISLEVPGGRLEFPDGVVAESRTPGFRVEPGRRYVFFTIRHLAVGPLEPVPLPAYALVDGFRGAVDLSEPDRKVRTMTRQPPPYAGEDVDAFLTRLRRLLIRSEGSVDAPGR